MDRQENLGTEVALGSQATQTIPPDVTEDLPDQVAPGSQATTQVPLAVNVDHDAQADQVAPGSQATTEVVVALGSQATQITTVIPLGVNEDLPDQVAPGSQATTQVPLAVNVDHDAQADQIASAATVIPVAGNADHDADQVALLEEKKLAYASELELMLRHLPGPTFVTFPHERIFTTFHLHVLNSIVEVVVDLMNRDVPPEIFCLGETEAVVFDDWSHDWTLLKVAQEIFLLITSQEEK